MAEFFPASSGAVFAKVINQVSEVALLTANKANNATSAHKANNATSAASLINSENKAAFVASKTMSCIT